MILLFRPIAIVLTFPMGIFSLMSAAGEDMNVEKERMARLNIRVIKVKEYLSDEHAAKRPHVSPISEETWQYDADGNLVKRSVRETYVGKDVHYTYDGAGNVVEAIHVTSSVCTADVHYSHMTFQRDGERNGVRMSVGRTAFNGWFMDKTELERVKTDLQQTSEYTVAYRYGGKGNMVERIPSGKSPARSCLDVDGKGDLRKDEQYEIFARVSCAYDAEGNRIGETYRDGPAYDYRYDKEGKRIERMMTHNMGTGKLQMRNTYAYDERGLVIAQRAYLVLDEKTGKESLSGIFLYEYGSEGEPIERPELEQWLQEQEETSRGTIGMIASGAFLLLAVGFHILIVKARKWKTSASNYSGRGPFS